MKAISGQWVHLFDPSGGHSSTFWRNGVDKQAREVRKLAFDNTEFVYKIIHNEGSIVIAILENTNGVSLDGI